MLIRKRKCDCKIDKNKVRKMLEDFRHLREGLTQHVHGLENISNPLDAPQKAKSNSWILAQQSKSKRFLSKISKEIKY